MDNIKLGEYHQLDDYIMKIENVFDQENYAGILIEISDWIGILSSKFKSCYSAGDNTFIFIPTREIEHIYRIDGHDVRVAEAKYILDVVKKMDEKHDAFLLNIKPTENRRFLWNLLSKFQQQLENK